MAARQRPDQVAVVATDLDGTLLRPDLTVSAATRDELRRVTEAGRQVVFVTGRPPRWMAPVLQATGHTGTAICANGAVTVDLIGERIVSHHALSADVLVQVAAAIRDELGPDVRFGLELAPLGPVTGSTLIHEPGFLPPALAGRELPLAELWDTADAVKLLARGPGPVAQTAAVAARVAARVRHLVTVSHASRTHQLLEIAPAGVTKATGLATLVADRQVLPGHVVAFGDMPNDIPMLAWAGWGVAVAGAHELVLQVADEVVDDPEHDGLAHWLRTHLP